MLDVNGITAAFTTIAIICERSNPRWLRLQRCIVRLCINVWNWVRKKRRNRLLPKLLRSFAKGLWRDGSGYICAYWDCIFMDGTGWEKKRRMGIWIRRTTRGHHGIGTISSMGFFFQLLNQEALPHFQFWFAELRTRLFITTDLDKFFGLSKWNALPPKMLSPWGST